MMNGEIIQIRDLKSVAKNINLTFIVLDVGECSVNMYFSSFLMSIHALGYWFPFILLVSLCTCKCLGTLLT